MPVVLIPVHFDRDPANRIPSCARSIVLRPFLTSDFMTGVPILPGTNKLSGVVSLIKHTCHRSFLINIISFMQAIQKMVRNICTIDGISRVLYDLTSKPPGTTEWE